LGSNTKVNSSATSWDDRYAHEGFVFGLDPNEFLKECVQMLVPGRVLSLGEGEGRNAVWLAKRGFVVRGTDLSAVAVEKAKSLATDRGVAAEFRVADLARVNLVPEAWDVIVSIFVHTSRAVRAHVHREVMRALKPGDHFIFTAYSPDQLGRGTGGPADLEQLVALADVEAELPAMEFIVAEEVERDVIEGGAHTGLASVTQVLARKPR
jgi:SAM-dependent methyltransferase